jgi:hypothetical protein
MGVTVLSQCSAASACERNWSTYDFIHSKKRNKLTPQRAPDLVHVFSDLCLAHKVNNIEFEEEMVSWMGRAKRRLEREQEGDTMHFHKR